MLSFGANEGHGKNHCHGNHAVRVDKTVALLAKTYGKAVRTNLAIAMTDQPREPVVKLAHPMDNDPFAGIPGADEED